MSDGFSDLINTSNDFFRQLARNNTKAWFEERKDFYVNEIRKPAELLAEIMADELTRMTGKPLKSKLFRIYRDVRFSRDKTPYNLHLHLSWSQRGEAAPSWFFGSSPDYLMLCAGVPGLSGDALTSYRAFIDQQGEAVAKLIGTAKRDAQADLSDFGAAPLKRVPRPYAPDHPQAELLKRKSLILVAPPSADWESTGLVPALKSTAVALLPFWRLLDEGPA